MELSHYTQMKKKNIIWFGILVFVVGAGILIFVFYATFIGNLNEKLRNTPINSIPTEVLESIPKQ